MFLGEDSTPPLTLRAQEGVWAERRQMGASNARPEPRNGARRRLPRRPEGEHTAGRWGLTPQIRLSFISKQLWAFLEAGRALSSSAGRNMSSLEVSKWRKDRLFPSSQLPCLSR